NNKKNYLMPIFTIPHSKGAISSFPINLSNILYFSRGNRIISKNISGTVTKTNYFTIEFAFLNNKEIYWYFEKEADREEEFSRLLSL
ncbi:MAG TPA: hypothetical protein VHC50_12570, partial [Puia sp.]|nr:hypothetical protein [Puia sp.]